MKSVPVFCFVLFITCVVSRQTNGEVGLITPSAVGQLLLVSDFPEKSTHSFSGVLNSRINHNAESRFSPLWYLDLLRRESEGHPFWDSASSNLRSVLRNGSKEAIREHFLVAGGLPALEEWKCEVENWLDGHSANRIVQFLARTLSGEEERDQISSPFHPDEGIPIKDYGSFRHKVSFGVRPFNVNNPYIFLGHSLRIDDERILTVQGRLYFEDWSRLTGELFLEVPIQECSLGGGLRIESRDWWYHNRREEQRHLFSFLGIRGPLPGLGGEFFVGTGFPETLTVYYSRRF